VDLLLERGARIDGAMVSACHANGRPEGARLLLERGAPLDLEAAAGLGRLDMVRSLFDNTATEKIRDGFAWACEYGHTETVAYFLERGVNVAMKVRNHGQTGLHWAAGGAHVDIVKLLLAHDSPLEAKDDAFGGTPLTWALWGFDHRDSRSAPAASYYEAVRLLIAAGAVVDPKWIGQQTDAAMRGILSQ
jgi:ankyrin repeat protein